MSWPNNHKSALAPALRPVPRPVRRLALCLSLCLLLAANLSGCGYGLAQDEPTVLGSTDVTLKVTGVEQPTLFPWVVYTVRSSLRNEITARNLAVWVDSGQADYNMHVKVNSFTMRSSVSSRADVTLIYTGTVSMTVIISRGSDNAEVWRNTISYSNEFDNDTEEEAGRRLFTQAVRRMAQSMRDNF